MKEDKLQKNPVVIIVVIVIVMIAGFIFIYKPFSKKPSSTQKPIQNPAKKIPQTNPFEIKTNPFKDIKTNPFR